jgi:hypothetical protein
MVFTLMKNELILVNGDNEGETICFTDVIGVFTSIEKLNEMTKDLKDTDTVFYEVKQMPVDMIVDNDNDDIGMDIEHLFKAGYLDLLVGDDGEFYFIPTKEDNEQH